MPNSSTVNIALDKKAKIVTGSEMPPFFANKLKANGGDPKDSMLVRFGGSKKVGGVTHRDGARHAQQRSGGLTISAGSWAMR